MYYDKQPSQKREVRKASCRRALHGYQSTACERHCSVRRLLTVSSSLAALWSSVRGMATPPRHSTALESPAHCTGAINTLQHICTAIPGHWHNAQNCAHNNGKAWALDWEVIA